MIRTGSIEEAGERVAQAKDYAHRTATLTAVAGRHFNRGQRTLFLALGYLAAGSSVPGCS